MKLAPDVFILRFNRWKSSCLFDTKTSYRSGNVAVQQRSCTSETNPNNLVALAASGNYVLQRMLEYAATHRGEGGNTESFFTAIVRSFAQDKGLVMAAQDHRGTFSVQKMVIVHYPGFHFMR